MATPDEIARVCHEANRALQRIQADAGVPVAAPWDDFPPDEQEGVVDGVVQALAGARPARLHESWCARKLEEGWRYGPVKDAEVKTHPCLVPYHELSDDQKRKDRLFSAIVAALGGGAP